jgi:hypothetical protein
MSVEPIGCAYSPKVLKKPDAPFFGIKFDYFPRYKRFNLVVGGQIISSDSQKTVGKQETSDGKFNTIIST